MRSAYLGFSMSSMASKVNIEGTIAKLLNVSSSFDRENLRDLLNDYFCDSDDTVQYDSDIEGTDSSMESDDDDGVAAADCDVSGDVSASVYSDKLSVEDKEEYEKATKFWYVI